MSKRLDKKIKRIANRILDLQYKIEHEIEPEINSLELKRLYDEISFQTMAEVDDYIMSLDDVYY